MAVDATWPVATSAEDQLVARAQRGDRDAFAVLIEQRAGMLLRTAQAILGNEDDASEAVQDTLIAAWIHLPGLRDSGRFDGWLGQALRNKCRDALRRRRRVREIDIAGTSIEGPDLTQEHVARSELLAAFDRLSVDDRHILVLHHLHELPLRLIADRLGVAVGTAKSRLWRARRALERALEAEA